MPIITCGNEKFDVPYANTVGSEYIKDIVEYAGDQNVTISVLDKYNPVIDNYINFLNGNEIPISSYNDQLLLSFQLGTLFADSNYFKYCVDQTFNNWSDACIMVYNDLNDDLQWSFFLYSPYSLIPKYLSDNELFMKQWNKINQNVIINVNHGNEVYYNNYKRIDDKNRKHVETYHVVNQREVGYKKAIVYFPNSDVVHYEEQYVDGKEDGVWRYWYNNDQHTLTSEQYYVNGEPDGVWRWWYDNDQHTLESERHYVDGNVNGVWRWWYDNDQHTLESEQHYVYGKEDGVWREWYNNDQHTLESEQHYVNGKEDGTWREWYDNEQHTLESEGHYVNNRRHGQWVEFDIDGNIISDEEYVDGQLIDVSDTK